MKTNRLLVLLCVAATLPAVAQNKMHDRINDSSEVLRQLLARKDAIPQRLLDKSVCVLVFPSVRKVGVGIGVTYGRGLISCRTGPQWTVHGLPRQCTSWMSAVWECN